MLEFFRKYQRLFFIFVTVIIIVTFSLFGSYRTLGQMEKKKEIIVGKKIDGSQLKYSEIKELSSLLGAESKNSVLVSELIRTGVANRLAGAFYDQLKADWQTRLDRARRCHFYAHPSAPFINAKEIWDQLDPNILKQVGKIETYEEVTPSFFSAWSELFLLQEPYSADLIKRAIAYQMNQLQVPFDQQIIHEDFALFGMQGVHDWMGSNFLDLVSQFILNTAIVAKEKGFEVSLAEAEWDLFQRLAGPENNLDMKLHYLGVKKNDAVLLWQKVLLFVRYYHEVGESTLIDDLPYRQFSDFASQKALIEQYMLPSELQLKNLDDWLAFEVYTRLACTPSSPLSLPAALLDPKDVEQRAPELVAAKYHLRYAQIDLRKMGSRLSMQEIWNWQLEDGHWDLLAKSFPEIQSVLTKDRFTALEKLEPFRRSIVDDWSRHQIIQSHPEWIEEDLTSTSLTDCDVAIFADGEIVGLSIRDANAFKHLLDLASSNDTAAIESLKAYREDDSIWRVCEVNKITDREILSLADAKKQGRIKIDQFLEDEYLHVRDQLPIVFQNENGDFKPFGEVKEAVIRMTFAKLFDAIDLQMKEKTEKGSLSFYVSHRFDAVMNEALHNLQSSGTLENNGLWPLEKSERTIARTSSEEWIMKQPFILNIGAWSDVYVPPNGEITFFYVLDHPFQPSPILDQIQQGKETLSSDTKCYLTDQLIERALKMKAIVLPIVSEKETNDDL